jgi:8-amino-3,8-dideoxy-alpha-D-manno-octulosonate transaminase
LPEFLSIQKKNYTLLKDILTQIPGISFRRIPDPQGDSCTFISWFLPDEDSTVRVVNALKEEGILAGNFYWFNNNWHYIRKWDHLKKSISLNRFSEAQEKALFELQDKSFAASDAILSRCISTLISLTWTEEQIKEKGEKIVAAAKKALAVQTA